FKYLLFLSGIVIIEALLVSILYLFAVSLKSIYILFSLAVIAGIVFYLINGRYREEIKIRLKGEVRVKYLKKALSLFAVLFAVAAAAIICAGAWLLISKGLRS